MSRCRRDTRGEGYWTGGLSMAKCVVSAFTAKN